MKNERKRLNEKQKQMKFLVVHFYPGGISEDYYGMYSDVTRSLLWPARWCDHKFIMALQWCNQKFIMACAVMQLEVYYGLHSDATWGLLWPAQWCDLRFIMACTVMRP